MKYWSTIIRRTDITFQPQSQEPRSSLIRKKKVSGSSQRLLLLLNLINGVSGSVERMNGTKLVVKIRHLSENGGNYPSIISKERNSGKNCIDVRVESTIHTTSSYLTWQDYSTGRKMHVEKRGKT